jgi:hypothetical protein
MIAEQRQSSQLPSFMEIFMIVLWCIWKEHNAYIFNNKMPTMTTRKSFFSAEVKLHLSRILALLHSLVMRIGSTLCFFR